VECEEYPQVHGIWWSEPKKDMKVPMNLHDLLVRTEHESAAMESCATDEPKAHPCRDGFSDNRQARMGPASGTHPWHQISIGSGMMGRHFQVSVLDMKYLGRIYVWGGLEGRCISLPNYGAA
jgi:hypothetical protein